MRTVVKQQAIRDKFFAEKLQAKTSKISNLEKEVASLKNLLAAAENRATKAESDANSLHQREKDERKKVADGIQKVVNSYEQVLMGVGEEVEVQEGVSVENSLEWLAGEMDIFVIICLPDETTLRSNH